MPFADVRGIRLRYELSGHPSRPTLILLHELGGSLESWQHVASALQTDFQVLRYDQRGAGGSSAIRVPYEFGEHVADLEALLDTLAIVPPYHLAGSAAGAAVAVLFAATGANAASLTLCCPAIGVDSTRRQYLLERARTVEIEGMAAIADATLARSFPPSVIRNRATFDTYRRRFLEADAAGYANANRAFAEITLEPSLGSVECRCLVLAGVHDTLRPPDAVRELSARLPRAQFAVVDSGHLMPVQAPEALTVHLRQFLGQETST
jgi:3-oxoadipate enol-lactonase